MTVRLQFSISALLWLTFGTAVYVELMKAADLELAVAINGYILLTVLMLGQLWMAIQWGDWRPGPKRLKSQPDSNRAKPPLEGDGY